MPTINFRIHLENILRILNFYSEKPFRTGKSNVDIGYYPVPRNSESKKLDSFKSSDTSGLALSLMWNCLCL